MEKSPATWGPPEEGAQTEALLKGSMCTERVSRGKTPSKKKAPFIPNPAMATREPMNWYVEGSVRLAVKRKAR
jgi:hypothetical protein